MGEIKLDELQRILAIGKEVDLHRRLKLAKQWRNYMGDNFFMAREDGADPEILDAIDRALSETIDHVARLADEYEELINENKSKGWS